MSESPRVSVVMTTKREPADRLERALASVAAQTYDGEIEVIVAAPPGEAVPPAVRVVENPTGARSPGLNRALQAATGAVIVRLDARSVLPPDYVATCVARLTRDASIGVVGGVQFAAAASDDVVARGIARALRNPWATGGAAYRRVGARGEVDTVYLGVFRRTELLALGGWDERLDANEDFDLCQRYRAAGFTVWLEPGVVVDYEARQHLVDVWRQYFAFGRAKVRYWRFTHSRPGKRQLGALGAVALTAAAAVPFPVTIPAAAAGLVVLDHVADTHERDPRVRAVALAAYLPVVGGWVSGIVLEALRLRR